MLSTLLFISCIIVDTNQSAVCASAKVGPFIHPIIIHANSTTLEHQEGRQAPAEWAPLDCVYLRVYRYHITLPVVPLTVIWIGLVLWMLITSTTPATRKRESAGVCHHFGMIILLPFGWGNPGSIHLLALYANGSQCKGIVSDCYYFIY